MSRSAEAPSREISRNGYTYVIDDRDRTRRVSGSLMTGMVAPRSKRAQLSAGGADRRGTDDGGHYIAARFNGPSDAFNHFAQGSKVNRGKYRALEDEWAREKRAGKVVTVKILPVFDDGSQRPSRLEVIFFVDGRKKSVAIPND
ncbi:DNA/RNA non-specific endonuclease [Sphingomonas adhaesiva]|uniref:DNA/RNA non-specific endonuclease n=1 Tax=Sphingomonas adhaesiva TaxID=28212 RepID=UPI002FF681AF